MAEYQMVLLLGDSKMVAALPEFSFSVQLFYYFEESLWVVATGKEAARSWDLNGWLLCKPKGGRVCTPGAHLGLVGEKCRALVGTWEGCETGR